MENNATLYHHGIKGQRWGVRRFQTKDGGLTAEGRKRYSLGETIHNYKVKKKRKAAAEKAREAKAAKAEHEKKAAAGKIDVKDMTDAEIRQAIARKQLENQYNQLHPKQVSKGEAFVKTLMDGVIKPAAVTAGKNFMTEYLDKVGKNLLKDQVDPNSIDALKDKYNKLDYKKKIMDLEDSIKNPNKRSALDELADKAKIAEYEKKIYEADKAKYDYDNRHKNDGDNASSGSEKSKDGGSSAKPKNTETSEKSKSGGSSTKSKDSSTSGESKTEKVTGEVTGEGKSTSKIKESMDSGKKWWESSGVGETTASSMSSEYEEIGKFIASRFPSK